MKNLYLTIAITILFCSPAMSQTAKKHLKTVRNNRSLSVNVDLPTISDKLHFELFNTSNIQLYIVDNQSNYAPKSAAYFANLIDTSKFDSLKIMGSSHYFKLLKSNVSTYLNNISRFGESQSDLYSSIFLPIDFIKVNNKVAFFQGGVLYDSKLNSFKLDELERARKVVNTLILPALTNFKSLIKIPSIDYFALCAFYLTKDFTNESDFDKVEMITIVISKDLLNKYLNAEATDSDVLSKADFYNYNKTMESSTIKKISFN